MFGIRKAITETVRSVALPITETSDEPPGLLVILALDLIEFLCDDPVNFLRFPVQVPEFAKHPHPWRGGVFIAQGAKFVS